MLKRLCEESIAQKGEHRTELLVSLEREIADRLASGGATQENVAKALGMSSRTLARKLATSGTTFFQVVDGYRKVTAESLISDTGLQLTQVAFLLGYSDLSSFSTAFRRWTGRRPSDLRRSSLGRASRS